MDEKLKVIISAEIDKLQKGCQDAQKEVEKFQKNGEQSLSKFKDAMSKVATKASEVGKGIAKGIGIGVTALATGAVAVGKSMSDNIAKTAEYGDNIDKMSQKMGVSAEGYQKWDFVMQHCGTSMDSMKGSMKTLSKSAESGSDAFSKLGLSQEQVASMSQEQLFDATIKGLQGMKNGTEKTALACELLGKGGTELGAVLNMSAKDTEAMKQQLVDMGGVMSNDSVSASAVFQDSLQNVKTALSGAKNAIFSQFMPSVSTAMDGLTMIFSGDTEKGAKQLSKGVEEFANKVAVVMPKVVDAIAKVLPVILDSISKSLPLLIKSIVDVAIKVVNAIVAVLPQLISALVGALPQLIDGLMQIVQGIITALPEIMKAICEALPSMIGQLINGVITLIVCLCENVSAILQPIIDNLPDIIMSIVDAILDNLPALIEGLIQLVLALVEATPKIILALVNEIPNIVVKLVTTLIESLPTIINGVIKLIGAIASALWELLKGLVSGIWDIMKSLWKGICDIFIGVAVWWYEHVTQPIINFFKGVWDSVSGFFKNLWNDITNIFIGIATWFSQHVTEPIAGFFRKMGDSIKDIWNGIWGAIKGVINGIIGGINGMIRGVCKGINFVIGALNKIHFDIPDWVPAVGGKSFGFSIKEVVEPQIPLLAKGGILDKPTLNIAGENGKEAIVPLEKNTEWIDMLVNKLTGSYRPIVLNVDGKTFAQTAISTINANTRQTGNIGLVIA